jgi:hypothetical protein
MGHCRDFGFPHIVWGSHRHILCVGGLDRREECRIVSLRLPCPRRVRADASRRPASLWRLPNFGVLFGVALLPFAWYYIGELSTKTTDGLLTRGLGIIFIIPFWQISYQWSSLNVAIRFLPSGIGGMLAVSR